VPLCCLLRVVLPQSINSRILPSLPPLCENRSCCDSETCVAGVPESVGQLLDTAQPPHAVFNPPSLLPSSLSPSFASFLSVKT
jgi:hypothetical protein